MTDTARLGIEFAEDQALWADVPFNDALRYLDANLNVSVVSATTTAEPGSPTNGQIYLLPSGKTGTNWGGYTAGELAYYSTTWTNFPGRPGMMVSAADTGAMFYCVSANTWVPLNAQKVVALGTISGATVLDLSLGKYYTATLGAGNVTLTFSNAPASGYAADVVLMLTQHASAPKTLTITGARYPNGIAYSATQTVDAVDHLGIVVSDTGSTIDVYYVENMG